MPEPTPEAWAQIRHDYENTDRPLAHICAEHDITVPMLRYRMKVWEWTRRKPLVPREGPPAVAIPPLPACGERSAAGAERGWPGEGDIPRTEAIESPPHPTSSLRSDVDLSPHTGRGKEEDPASIVPRLQGAVARVLPAIEATIARLAAGAHHPREMEQAGRTLSSLTRTLRELNALLAEHNARPAGACDCCDMPEDMDAFREELAQQIEKFLASRSDDAFE